MTDNVITRGYRPFPCSTEDTIPEGLRIILREPLRVYLDPLPTHAEDLADLIRENAERAMRIAGIQPAYPGYANPQNQAAATYWGGMGQAGSSMGNPGGVVPPYGGGYHQSFPPNFFGPPYGATPCTPPIQIWSTLRKLFQL